MAAFNSTAETERGNSNNSLPLRGLLESLRKITLNSLLFLAQWVVLGSHEMKYEHVITIRDTYIVEMNITASLSVSDISDSISPNKWSLTLLRGHAPL